MGFEFLNSGVIEEMLANKDWGGWKERLNKVIPFLGKALDSKSQNEWLNDASRKVISAITLPSYQKNQEKSLYAWVHLYLKTQVSGAPLKTQQAKCRDLERFARCYVETAGSTDPGRQANPIHSRLLIE